MDRDNVRVFLVVVRGEGELVAAAKRLELGQALD
jgi:DNA-binding transcriptional LysR family regulator